MIHNYTNSKNSVSVLYCEFVQIHCRCTTVAAKKRRSRKQPSDNGNFPILHPEGEVNPPFTLSEVKVKRHTILLNICFIFEKNIQSCFMYGCFQIGNIYSRMCRGVIVLRFLTYTYNQMWYIWNCYNYMHPTINNSNFKTTTILKLIPRY